MGEHLASDPGSEVRRSVASSRFTAEHLVVRMTADKDPTVRHTAAGVVSHAGALERLAADPSPLVRAVVAANSATPAQALERLCGDRGEAAARAAAPNPSTPTTAARRTFAQRSGAAAWLVLFAAARLVLFTQNTRRWVSRCVRRLRSDD